MMGATMPLRADSNKKWLIVYSKEVTSTQLRGVDIAIVEPDAVKPARYPASHTRFYGYVSVGAVHNHRAYWPKIRSAPYVLEKDPEWPDSYRIDIRAKAWQQLLLNEVIPELSKEKFSGVFLDTIDNALYLEELDPKRFAKSRAALVQFIKAIKKKFPRMGILPNNGFPILNDIGTVVDGTVAEDVYTRYNFTAKTYDATPMADTLTKEAALDQFIQKFKKPVYVVLYGDPKSLLVQHAIARCRDKGYHWYVSTVDLTKVGELED